MKKQTKTAQGKARPTNATELLDAVRRGSGLDCRTSYSKAITDTQRIVANNPEEAVHAVMANSLATWAVIQQAVTAELTREKKLIVDGQLHPLINELAKVQLSLASSARGVLNTTTKAKPRSGGKVRAKGDDTTIDISALFNDEVTP